MRQLDAALYLRIVNLCYDLQNGTCKITSINLKCRTIMERGLNLGILRHITRFIHIKQQAKQESIVSK